MLKKLYALKNKKGFTLVELMVVVAILGILVAVAVPVYKNATGDAKNNACATNVKTIESAFQMARASGEKDEDVDTVDELVAKNYLTDTVKCPVKDGAKYTIYTTSGKVTCDHGKAE